jgi:MoaA/NifB/PqqE/SkfB family radical SAM enzyme
VFAEPARKVDQSALHLRFLVSYERIIRKTWQENILYSVLVELTYACNLDCAFCYNHRGIAGKPLTTGRLLALLDDLADMQVLNLVLSGGEPLAHPDFFTIGARARELGFVVRVKTNGHGLNRRVARRLIDEVDPMLVDISLHGAGAATHDRQTRVPGSFDRLMATLPELQSTGLRLKLNCTLTRWNEGEIEGIFAIADELGVAIEFNPNVSPRDDGDRGPLQLSPSREGRLRLFQALLDRRQEGSLRREAESVEVPVPTDKNCGAGSSTLTIDPVGNVLPCVQWRRPVGNLHERSIREIWEGSLELARARRTTREAKAVVDSYGPEGRFMGFCPALAELRTGDPLKIYTEARDQMELFAQAKEERAGRAAP